MDIAAINEALAPSRDQLAMEGLHFLGAGFELGDNPIPPPVAGSLTLLECIKSPWAVGGSSDATENDVMAALAILDLRENGVGLVMEAIATDDPAEQMARYCLIECEWKDAETAINSYFQIAKIGFNFFPAGGADSSEFCFGAEYLAAICRVMGEHGIAPYDAIWREPLARLAFMLPSIAKATGAKNIGRENTLDWERAWQAIHNTQQ